MKKVAILFGGQSTEHEVSCLSAYSVLKNIDRDKFEPVPVGITKAGDWCVFDGPYEEIKSGEWKKKATKGVGIGGGIGAIYACDVVFPVIHGIMAEDGTLQGLLELTGKPYVGPGVLASSVAMDKVYTKIVLDHAKIPQARYIVAERSEIMKNDGTYEKEVEDYFGFPCFVKPSNSGSSVGAFKVSSKDELNEKLSQAAVYDRKVLIEEYVNAREVECAVLGNMEPTASTPGEVIPSKEFYDYEDKYIAGTSVVQIPAKISDEDKMAIQQYAVEAFKALGCAGLSRVDFFISRDTGKVMLNEINTLPGFTDISMYAKMIAYDGMSFKDLVTRLLELAEENRQINKRISLEEV